uniref:Uncharacterized protein n=1 Tax=Arion vulgaris TaxID=1028688 RepID=A0A0B7AGY4_9EUPU
MEDLILVDGYNSYVENKEKCRSSVCLTNQTKPYPVSEDIFKCLCQALSK